MKKLILFGVFSILSIYCYSQIHFEKGYFIDNSNNKTNCLIKNMDWMYNPTEFTYKLSENSNTEIKTIDKIKEFSVSGIKYKKAFIDIDVSSDKIGDYNYKRNPDFKKETVLLKVLIEGKANLYSYRKINLERFYYSTNSTDIIPLVYKHYMKTSEIAATNNQYQQQLWMNLRKDNISMQSMKKIKYKQKDLEKYFNSFNGITDTKTKPKTATREKEQNKDKFNLYLKTGLSFSSVSINKGLNQVINFKNATTPRLELEIEYVLPFNKNKWALILSPAYQHCKFKSTNSATHTLDYKFIELQFGGRHYMFLNDNSKISLTGLLLNSYSDDSTLKNNNKPIRYIDNKRVYLNLGVGYTYKNKYSLELKYSVNRNLLQEYDGSEAPFDNISISLGYNLF